MTKTTQTERVSKVLRKPGWHPWSDFAWHDRHSVSQCISKLNEGGWTIAGRKQAGKRTWEYRMVSAV